MLHNLLEHVAFFYRGVYLPVCSCIALNTLQYTVFIMRGFGAKENGMHFTFAGGRRVVGALGLKVWYGVKQFATTSTDLLYSDAQSDSLFTFTV